MNQHYLTFRVDQFLDAVAAREPAPGGGAVAAVVTAAAASLTAMAARFSADSMAHGDDLARDADRIRDQVGTMADADARAYSAVRDAYTQPRSGDLTARRERIRSAVWHATEVPVQIAELGADTAELAIRLVEAGNRHLVGDAYAAIALSEAAVRAAATLVRINAHTGKLGDDLVNRADRAVRAVDRLSRTATSLIGDRYSTVPAVSPGEE